MPQKLDNSWGTVNRWASRKLVKRPFYYCTDNINFLPNHVLPAKRLLAGRLWALFERGDCRQRRINLRAWKQDISI